MNKHLFAAILALAGVISITSASAAQSGVISGSVQTADALPVPSATVRLNATSFGTLTDAQGNFRIARVPRGNYTLVVEQLGFVSAERGIVVSDSVLYLKLVITESPIAMSGVVVTATGAAERHMTATTAIGAVTGPDLRELRASHPAEVVSRVAGAWVNVSGSGEGHMTAIRQPLTTAPVYLFLEDGIPTRSTGFFNHNGLYEINVPQAGRVEVLKGPGTALYGSDAIGGVVNVETRAPSLERTVEWFAEAGGHGWARTLGSVSGSSGKNGLRADVNYTRWGGWRDATGYDRQSVTLRWDHQWSDATNIKTVFAFSDIDQIDPSPLARAVFDSAAQVNEFPIATRAIRALRLSSSLNTTVGSTSFALTPFLRTNEMEIVPSWMLSFDPVTYNTGHKSAGVIARARRELAPLRSALTAGFDVDYSPGFREEYRINTTRDGATYTSYDRGALIYDYDVTFVGASPYLQLESNPFGGLHADFGLRYDNIRYDYDSHLDEVQTGQHRRPGDTQTNFDQLSPKVGLAYDFGVAALYGSYRHSFRAPSEGQLFRQGSAVTTVDLKPIRADAYEVGARGAFASFDFEISAYDMRVLDDVLTFITAENLRESVNAGETRHRGVEVTAGWQTFGWLRLDAAVSRARHTYEVWQPRATVDYSGNEIAAAPRDLINLRARVSPAFMRGGSLSADLMRVGGYWEDPENTSRYDGHSLVNLRARYPVWQGMELIVRATNIFDERYAEQATFNTFERERLTPGAPRMLYVGLQGRWPSHQDTKP
jgi:outer membrane receptor protein involved in Fe transport